MSLTANLLDDVQRVLTNVNGLSLDEIHRQLGKYPKPHIQEALAYLVRGDGMGKVTQVNGYYRLARSGKVWV